MTNTAAESRARTSPPQWLLEGAGLAVSLLIVFAVAALGALFMPGAWYASLEKPPLNPPNWIFGPVWTTLYFLMAVSAWLVWRQRQHRAVGWPLLIFGVQLALNGLWSPLFFGAQLPFVALIDLVALWGALVATIVAFWPISRSAAALLLPYLAWITFAGYLNAALWWLNR